MHEHTIPYVALSFHCNSHESVRWSLVLVLLSVSRYTLACAKSSVMFSSSDVFWRVK